MPVTIVGNNTPTAGGVVYGDGTNYASTAAGTSGQLLQSNGLGAPTWTAAPAASAMIKISTLTASTSTDLSWTGLTVYDKYIIYFQNIIPTTGGYLYVRLGTGAGPTYATSNYYWAGFATQSSTTGAFDNAANSSAIAIGAHSGGTYTVGAGSSGYVVIENFLSSSATDTVVLAFSTTQSSSGPNYQSAQASGYLFSNGTAKTAIQILSIGDTLASGSATLYGISS